MTPFIILGIIQGTVIGLLALGLVLVYKGARVFNFAQAEFGSLAAYFAFAFISTLGLPYALGVVLALVSVGLLGFTIERVVVRPLFNAPRVTLLVASAGIALASIALLAIFGKVEVRQFPAALGTGGFTLFGVVVGSQDVLLLAVFGGLAIGLAYFFNRTDLGLAVLATSQEPVATELAGISTRKISSFIWTSAAVLGGVAGILQAPDTVFFPGFMTINFLLPAFTAAIVGGITSLAGAFLGGLVIGVTQQIGAYVDGTYVHGAVPGVPDLFVFGVLLAILLARPQGLLGREA